MGCLVGQGCGRVRARARGKKPTRPTHVSPHVVPRKSARSLADGAAARPPTRYDLETFATRKKGHARGVRGARRAAARTLVSHIMPQPNPTNFHGLFSPSLSRRDLQSSNPGEVFRSPENRKSPQRRILAIFRASVRRLSPLQSGCCGMDDGPRLHLKNPGTGPWRSSCLFLTPLRPRMIGHFFAPEMACPFKKCQK